jgi:hypothetical protein
VITEAQAHNAVLTKAILVRPNGTSGPAVGRRDPGDGLQVRIEMKIPGLTRWAHAWENVKDVTFADPDCPAAGSESVPCGRCGIHFPAGQIWQTGPYWACTTCTRIIRNR